MPEVENKRAIFLHARKRFMDEAMTLKRLAYIPQVVKITDYFYENNSAYFVMEFLRGRTLRQLVGQEGPLPLDRALYIIQSAGSALERIHTDIGIFHRDISPENIMLCDGGSVKLIDFGSAKDLSRRTNQQFTIVLKAGYAPPEQYSATTPQGRCSDVYALAGTLYYLLTRSNIPDAPSRISGAADLPQKPEAHTRPVRVRWRGSERSWRIENDRTVCVGRGSGCAVRLPENARLASYIPQQRGSQAAIGGPPLPAAREEARGSQIQYRPTPLQNPRYTRDLRRCAAHP